MIPGGQKPPYRKPCGGTVLCSSGPRYQHARPEEKNIPVFIYNSEVPNWTGDGNIAPYERFEPTVPSCGTSFCTGVAACGDADNPPCIPWIGGESSCQYGANTPPPTPSFYQPQMLTNITIANGGSGYSIGDVLSLAGGTGSSYIGPGSHTAAILVVAINGTGVITSAIISVPGSYKTNPSSPNSVTGGHGTGASFTLTFANQTENLSPCFKYGYKNVQAARQWHGAPGYFFNSPVNMYACNSGGSTACEYEQYVDYSLSASQTKYLTYSYDLSATSNNNILTASDEESGSITVDPESGVCTVNSFSPGCGMASVVGIYAGMSAGQWMGLLCGPPAKHWPRPGQLCECLRRYSLQ